MQTSTVDSKRQSNLGILARASATALAEQLRGFQPLPEASFLRKPETGTLMLRARMGGNGAVFNLGEAAVTRCTLRLADGRTGTACVLGTSKSQARQIALCDALLQGNDALAQRLQREVVDVLARAEQTQRAQTATAVAGSKVDFFTLVRGEDA